MASVPELRLGLIGRGISRSLAPRLHPLLGQRHGLRIRYELIDADSIPGFDLLRVSQEKQRAGFAGLNITRPFKQGLLDHVRIEDPQIRRIESINSLRFTRDGWIATSTDYSGFLRAYRRRFDANHPGDVVLIGAGGVGRAVGFALAELGASRIAIYDVDNVAAGILARSIHDRLNVPTQVLSPETLPDAMEVAQGLANCSQVGMYSSPGTPFPSDRLRGRKWAFDAVYTPPATRFLKEADAAGLAILPGFDLFFFQGLDAFTFFTGIRPDPDALWREVSGWATEK